MRCELLPQEVAAVVRIRRDLFQVSSRRLHGFGRRPERILIHAELYDRHSQLALDFLRRIFRLVRGYSPNVLGNHLGKVHFRSSRLN